MSDDSPELLNARKELKQLIRRLYTRLDQLGDVDDEFEIDPERNIADNFICKRRMRCERCKIQFHDWIDFDQHNLDAHNTRLQCEPCGISFENPVKKANHDLLEHAHDKPLAKNFSSLNYQDGRVCCSLCRRHFIDIQTWVKHYGEVHAPKTGPVLFDWMVEKCDMKGLVCTDTKLKCELCRTHMPFAFDTFNFENVHGNRPKHRKHVSEYFKNHGSMPEKFLKGTNSKKKYHPHELQSSCCCKTPDCPYCPIHKSCMTKFRRGDELVCQFCKVTLVWESFKSVLEHTRMEIHLQALDKYILTHGSEIQFHWMFRRSNAEPTKPKKPSDYKKTPSSVALPTPTVGVSVPSTSDEPGSAVPSSSESAGK